MRSSILYTHKKLCGPKMFSGCFERHRVLRIILTERFSIQVFDTFLSNQGKYFPCLHSESYSSSFLHLVVTLHSSEEHQDVHAHTCCQNPKLVAPASFVLVKVQHKLGHIQRLLTMRFQHSPMSYPAAR